jgi:hypothetical protein
MKEKRREDEEEDLSSYWMTLRKIRILEIETRSAISHHVANSIWKKLWTYRNTDCVKMILSQCQP